MDIGLKVATQQQHWKPEIIIIANLMALITILRHATRSNP